MEFCNTITFYGKTQYAKKIFFFFIWNGFFLIIMIKTKPVSGASTNMTLSAKTDNSARKKQTYSDCPVGTIWFSWSQRLLNYLTLTVLHGGYSRKASNGTKFDIDDFILMLL